MKRGNPPPAKRRSTTPAPKRKKTSVHRSLEGQCRTIYRELHEVVRQVFGQKRIPLDRVKDVRLLLEAVLEPGHVDTDAGRDLARRFTDRLLGRIRQLALDVGNGDMPFPAGRVYCFWCGSFECAHAQPSGPRAAFRGYSPTGEPLWAEFTNLALEEHHPRVESLYRENASPITLVRSGSDLTREQLGVYGKNSSKYRILGQVLVGYLTAIWGKEERSRTALTIQAIETGQSRQQHFLNVVGVLPDGQPAGLMLEELVDSRVADALALARSKLAELSLTSSGKPGKKKTSGDAPRRRPARQSLATREKKALTILQRLARNIERIYRQSSRRTQHARDRHRDRERPASTALRDALEADDSSIFRDIQADTWVVVGPRSRVHFFNHQGQHVSSVVYPGETIRKRTTQGKWKRGSAEEREQFTKLLRSPGPT